MTESAPAAKRYRNHALKLRQEAKDTSPDNAARLRLVADNYEGLARTIESAITARKLQRAFGDRLP